VQTMSMQAIAGERARDLHAQAAAARRARQARRARPARRAAESWSASLLSLRRVMVSGRSSRPAVSGRPSRPAAAQAGKSGGRELSRSGTPR
jgi:hypothetical protein